MVDVARVNLYGQPLGSVRWDQRYEVAQFEYDPNFARQGIEPSPLMMPVREGRVYSFGELDKTTFKGLPGMLADSLPDTYGRVLFEKWLTLTGRTSGNAIETLCFLGKRCMGALEFEPAIDAVDTDIRIEVDSLVDVAREALADKSSFNVNIGSDKKAAIAEILRLGTSAGGQRAKAIIAYNKATGEIRSGQVEAPKGFDYYIIKLDGVSATAGFRETENFGRLEYSFSRLVKECGIDMAECSLIEENGRAHFLTKRFDRINGAKVHMQTLCGIAHFDYRLLRAYSHEQAFAVMRGLRLTYKEAQEMFRRPGRPHEEHLVPDGQRREMAPFSGLRHGLRLQSRRPVDLCPPDVDKRQIQWYYQRRPARMRGQEQHQECRTDYRRGLPGGIRMAGDRPGVRSAAKDDRGDPAEYGFLLIVWFDGVLQLYFIPVFLYTFIKVKSK